VATPKCQICGRRRRRSDGPSSICAACTLGRDSSELLRFENDSRRIAPPPKKGSISQRLPPLPPPMKRKKLKFSCCHCSRTLRIPKVMKRTKVRCPTCAGDFYVLPDGTTEEELPVAQTQRFSTPKIKKKVSEKKSRRSKRHSTLKLTEGEIIPHRTVTRSGRQRKTMFESGDFDGSATGFSFETVTGLEGRDLDELRNAAGIDDDVAEQGYQLLPADEEPNRKTRHKRKGKRKKRVSSNQGYRILTETSRENGKKSKKAKRGKSQSKTGKDTKRHSADTAKESSERPVSKRASSRYHELSGQGMSSTPSRTGTWSLLSILVLLPLLFFIACLVSTTRGQGFAASGGLGQKFDKLGQSVQQSVRQLLGNP
jgi:hypothetical protein